MEEEKKIESEETTEVLGNTGVIDPVVEEPTPEVIETPTEPVPEPTPVEQTVTEAPAPEAPAEQPAEQPTEPAVAQEAPAEPEPVAAPAEPPVSTPEVPKPKKKSMLPMLLVIVLVLAVGGFAVWYFVLGGNGSKNPKPTDNPTQNPSGEPTGEPTPTKPEDNIPEKTEEDIKKLYTNVFNANDNLIAAFFETDDIGSLYNNGVKSLFAKEKVPFSSLNLDENGKFEFAIHSGTTAEIYQIRDTYESLFGGNSFVIKEYKTSDGLFTCGYDEAVYTCTTDVATGGISAEPSIRIKYGSFTQNKKTIEINIYALLCDGQKIYSIKDNKELYEVSGDPFDDANKEIYSKYTYKATFEIDGNGYKFISVEPNY